MNELFMAMSSDLCIPAYKNEQESSYIGRICFSGLGLWCLFLALNEANRKKGISKNSQTKYLVELIQNYNSIEKGLGSYLNDSQNKKSLAAKIRQVYENVGYLSTDSNKSILANYGVRVSTNSKKDLYLGIPSSETIEMNGLGVYVDAKEESLEVERFLARKNLSEQELITSRFDLCDFEERDIDVSELSFFNPFLKVAPSQAWQKGMAADYSIARASLNGPYYRVIRDPSGKLFFCEEIYNDLDKGLYAKDFRTLYFALRAYYNNPLPVWISHKDEYYSTIQLSAKLPEREYALLLLSSWPVGNVFNTNQYLIRNELISMVTEALKAVYFSVKEF